MTTLSIHELATESAELLPARETLDFIHLNYADVWASNSALALNAAALYSNATATASHCYRHDHERSLNTMDFTVAIQDEELARESAELLPTRETLDLININIAPVTAVNLAIAVNAATIISSAQAYAGQWITLATSS